MVSHGEPSAGESGRIKHIVMWNVAGRSEEERTAAISSVKSCFEGLRGLIPGMVHLEVGVDISRIDYACDVVLYTEFATADALRDYAGHPAHIQVRDQLEGIRIARHQVDYVAPP